MLSASPFHSQQNAETLRSCHAAGEISLSPEFQKDVTWFPCYLFTINGFYIIHDDMRVPVKFVCGCMRGCMQHMGWSHLEQGSLSCSVPQQQHQTEAPHLSLRNIEPRGLNVVVAVHMWARKHHGKLIHLFCNNEMAVALFQVGKGCGSWIQACERQLWLISALNGWSHMVCETYQGSCSLRLLMR